MAYTATLTKASVSKQGNLYRAAISVVINDGVDDVLDFEVSEKYNPNAPNMDGVKNGLQNQIKEKWDEYAENKNIFDATAFTSLVSSLQTQTNTYING